MNCPEGLEAITSGGVSGASHHFDEAAGVVSVRFDKTSGDHAICVVPADSDTRVCPTTTTDGEGDSKSPSPNDETPDDAAPASPASVRPDYTR